jgi:AcrR family transcriptional regulator
MAENMLAIYACTLTPVNVMSVTTRTTREALLDAAAELIAEHRSVDQVSLRAVAGRAGVSPMAVYNHFTDRGALLDAAVDRCWSEFQGAIARAIEGEDDPYLRLRAAGDAYVRFALDHPGRYRVMFSTSALRPAAGPPVGLSAFDQLVTMVAAVLDANGDDRDPVFVAAEVHTWIHGIVDLVACNPEGPWPSVDALREDLALRLGLTPG